MLLSRVGQLPTFSSYEQGVEQVNYEQEEAKKIVARGRKTEFVPYRVAIERLKAYQFSPEEISKERTQWMQQRSYIDLFGRVSDYFKSDEVIVKYLEGKKDHFLRRHEGMLLYISQNMGK